MGTLSDDCARGSKSSKKVARRRVPLLWCDSYPDLAIWVFWRTWKKLAGLAWCRSPLGKWCLQCPWGAEKTRLLTQRFRSCKHHQFLEGLLHHRHKSRDIRFSFGFLSGCRLKYVFGNSCQTTYECKLIQSKASSLERAARGSLASLLSLRSSERKEGATFLQMTKIFTTLSSSRRKITAAASLTLL